VDVFYVKDVFGHKVTHDGKLKRIREHLLASIEDPDAPVEPARATARERAAAAV
jgi:[protein-PII] uridylyltransferase